METVSAKHQRGWWNCFVNLCVTGRITSSKSRKHVKNITFYVYISKFQLLVNLLTLQFCVRILI